MIIVSSYSITTPSFVKAVNLTPTGTDNNAEISAMCSFPFPLAIDNATSAPKSKLSSFGFIFLEFLFLIELKICSDRIL